MILFGCTPQWVLNTPVRNCACRAGTKIMLLEIGLATALLVGFVLGRLWEMRQRLKLAKLIDVRTRPVEIRAPTKVSEQPPSNDGRLAALDRELNDLLKFAAVQG